MPIASKTVGVEVKASMSGAPQVSSGLSQITAGLKEIGGGAASTALISLGALAGGVGTVVTAGKALVGMATDLENTALAYDKLSQKTGASVQFLSGFTEAAKDTQVSAETVSASLVKFTKNLEQTKGSGADVQRELMALANQFAQMPNGPEKTALAMQNFGRAGAEMIPILNKGASGIREMIAEADRMGLVINNSTVEASKRLYEQVDRLNDAFEGLKNKIGGEVIPVLVDGLTQANSAVSVLFTQMTIADGWAKMIRGAQMSQAELIKLKDAIDIYNSSMRGSSTMTDSMVDALAGAPGAASAMGASMVQASEDALRAAANTQVAMAMLQSAQGAAAAASAAAVAKGIEVDSARYAAQAKLYAKNISAQQRANQTLTNSLRAVGGTAKEVGGTMMGEFAPALENATRAAGGAAKAIDKVTDAQDALKQRTSEMQGLMGSSLEPMNKMQKLQAAYALATGQSTLAQEQMKISVQGVMKGFEAGSISMADALGLVLALRNGQIDYTRALQAAGPAAQPYINDLNEFTAAATDGTAKVLQLSQGVDKLPGAPKPVTIDVKTTGVPVLDDLHDRVMSLPTEKTVTIKAVVIGLDQLAGTFYDYAPRTGSQPIIPTPGNLDTGGAPPAASSSTTVNVNVDGARVAQANVNNGAGATATNKRRNYRQP